MAARVVILVCRMFPSWGVYAVPGGLCCRAVVVWCGLPQGYGAAGRGVSWCADAQLGGGARRCADSGLHAEVLEQLLGAGAELVVGEALDDLPLGEQVVAVGHGAREADVLLDEQHRHA